MSDKQPTPQRAARRLNAHHAKTGAGFYVAGVEGESRCFSARVRAGRLEISSDGGDNWSPVDLTLASFRDHNGKTIFL